MRLTIAPPSDERPAFRRVLATTAQEQFVRMTLLRTDGHLGLERHADTTQTFFIADGRGSVQLNHGDWQAIGPGDVIVVPADTWHDVRAETERLVLLTTYAPPHHPDGLVQLERPGAPPPVLSCGRCRRRNATLAVSPTPDFLCDVCYTQQ